ncbi:hypothetical protein NQ317_015644 [Molorchus minor]|uniref:Uncharacterized protein n=1 Tax=Molorchus minor TaxID=1323400 RepID=A0ABQ9JVY9_9CUCU|nr:hypothetical protein NQ317_015644 [Molorchus minor]
MAAKLIGCQRKPKRGGFIENLTAKIKTVSLIFHNKKEDYAATINSFMSLKIKVRSYWKAYLRRAKERSEAKKRELKQVSNVI